MEVHLAPELQAKLTNAADQQGRRPEDIVQDALTQYFEDESRFIEAVERGLAAADRGEFIEEEEMDARMEQMFKR